MKSAMKRFPGLLALVIVCLVLCGLAVRETPARGDSGFRCESGRLVFTGDHMYEVRKKCGDPDMVTQRLEKRKVTQKVRRWIGGVAEEVDEEREVEIPIDEWVFDLGPERFIRIVSFEDSRVTCVNTGDYGKKRN
jgi:hypothetical protein